MSTITIGLDVGDRWSEVCVLDAGGTVRTTRRVRTTAPALEPPRRARRTELNRPGEGLRLQLCSGSGRDRPSDRSPPGEPHPAPSAAVRSLKCEWKRVGELRPQPPRRPLDNLAFSWKLQAWVRGRELAR